MRPGRLRLARLYFICEKSMWYVYILENRCKNFIYVGFTSDLDKRLRDHRNGLTQSTKAYRPLELKTYIAVPTKRKARELEKYLKVGSGKAILKKRILSDEALA